MTLEDEVEAVARAIDPDAWKRRDEDLRRGEEWEAGIKAGWGDITLKQWANRSVVKSLKTARAAITALDKFRAAGEIGE